MEDSGGTDETPTAYPKKYAHGFCFDVLCCGYTLTDFPISTRLTSLALWQSNDCPSASKATLMNMDKYFMWIDYERLHNHNKAKHNKTVCIFLGIYCMRPERSLDHHAWALHSVWHCSWGPVPWSLRDKGDCNIVPVLRTKQRYFPWIIFIMGTILRKWTYGSFI